MELADDVTGSPASTDAQYRPATLRERIDGGPLPPEECLLHARQLLAGLACIHDAGMVHRDVKPANCLFVDGTLKVADFGLLTEANTQVSRLGTLKYMPPDGRMDAAADVYAVGLVIYEMMTGLSPESFPHLGRRAREVAENQQLRGLNRLVLCACDPASEARFADAAAMLAHLDKGEKARVKRRTATGRRLLAIGMCLCAGMILAALGLWSNHFQAVDVNFITSPFEATIYLDGAQLLKSNGRAYTTPCSVPNLPARAHHVVFRRVGLPDLDAGTIDFAQSREINIGWPENASRR